MKNFENKFLSRTPYVLKIFVVFTTVLLLCSSYSLSATSLQDSFIPDLDIVNLTFSGGPVSP